MDSRQKKRKKNSLVGLTAVFLLLITIIPIIILSVFKEDSKPVSVSSHSEHLDERAEKIKKHFWESDKKNDEGQFSYEINKTITFKGDNLNGKINLSNPYCNNLFMFAELTLKQDEKVIFRSGLLRPGEKIENASLDIPVPAGEYEGFAVICAIDPENEELTGYFTQPVKIEIKK